MKARQLLLVLFAFFTATITFAQKTNDEEVKKETKKPTIFAIKGEFRSRFESSPMNGRNILAPEKTPLMNILGQRARITMCYHSKKIDTKISVQDIRYFGQNKTTGDKIWSSTNGAGLAVHEAWGKFNFINNENRTLGLKIGRQELNFADARLFWNKNWLHQAAAHDAVNLQCRNKEFDVDWDLGFAYNSVDDPGKATPYKIGSASFPNYRFLGFANISKRFGKMVTLNVTNLYEGFEQDNVFADGKQDSTYYRNTIGFNPIIKKSGFKFNGSFYYQLGQQKDLKGTNAGMMYTANVSYTIDKKYTIGAGYDSYSGRSYNDTTDSDVNKSFSAPYAGAHKFFGCTDFHLKLFGKGLGLNDINVKLSAKFTKQFIVKAEFHMISFGNTAAYTNSTGDNVEFTSVGNNVDLMLVYKLAKTANVKFGYSLMLPGEDFTHYSLGYTGTDAVNAQMHNFVWVMFSFNPTFFKSVK